MNIDMERVDEGGILRAMQGSHGKQRSIQRSMPTSYIYILIGVIVAGLCVPFFTFAQTLEERRAELERQLNELEKEIQGLSTSKVEKSRERVTLESEIAILDAEIEKARLSIRHQDLTLTQIRNDISDKQEVIRQLNEKLAKQQDSMAQIIRRTREFDDVSLVELALSGATIADFFEDVDTFEILHREMKIFNEEVKALKSDLGVRTERLEDRHQEEARLRQLQVLEKQEIEARERERQEVLRVTRGEEARFQQMIADREKTAAEIRAALFSLRDSADISFGVAYEYAKAAEAVTGVRAAFVLGILKNESDLGKNVGQCLLTNSPNKGDGVGKNTGRAFSGVMHPNRDVDPFMQIAVSLGFDPFSQVVSCPQSVGYGGAMGPAQFIPSTWMMYKDRVARAVGQGVANPWDPRTAFFASSIFLGDLGANRGTRAAENEAALRYFAGGGWKNPAFASYGDRVLRFADEFQAQIDILERN